MAESARRCGLEPGVVEAYAMLYHDVLHLLYRRGYVANRLLPRRAALGVAPGDVGGLLKLAAWKGGPLALETALRVLTGTGVPRERFSELSRPELEDALSEVHCRFWVLVQTLPLTAFLPWSAGRLRSVEDALAALSQEADRDANRPAAADVAARVMLDGEADPEVPASRRAGELLAALHGALDAIGSEFGHRAA